MNHETLLIIFLGKNYSPVNCSKKVQKEHFTMLFLYFEGKIKFISRSFTLFHELGWKH